MEDLYSIVITRLERHSKGFMPEELVTIGAEVDFKMRGELSKALAILARSGKEVIMNEDNVFCLVDIKQAKSVIDQLKVSSVERTTQL